MKEIIFRAKKVSNGQWVYGSLLEGYPYHKDRGHKTIVETGMLYHEIDPSTVCQFTGKYDKNKERIFHGDIVTCGNL